MLPFLKKDRSIGLIVKTRQPDEKPENSENTSELAILECAQDLIKAIQAQDAKAVAKALKDSFEILEMLPHDEVEHEESEEVE